MALKPKNIPRGTGYYFREPDLSAVYVCWRDNDCVTLMSTAYPGHQAGTTTHRGKDNAGNHSSVEVPLPSVVKHYNMFMGGVDKSDQLVSYHRIIRQTKKYWKTLLYHLLEIAAANSFILRKFLLLQSHQKTITESQFQDQLVLQIAQRFHPGVPSSITRSLSMTYRIFHGSTAFPTQQRHRCAVCSMKTARECKDCPFTPALCQNSNKDCHGTWHSEVYTSARTVWFFRKQAKSTSHHMPNLLPTSNQVSFPSKRGPGRPTGSKDRRKRRKT